MKTNLISKAFAVASFMTISLLSANHAMAQQTDSTQTQQHKHHKKDKKDKKTMYQCPMDKDQISDKPGKCPKCGMEMVKMKMKK